MFDCFLSHFDNLIRSSVATTYDIYRPLLCPSLSSFSLAMVELAKQLSSSVISRENLKRNMLVSLVSTLMVSLVHFFRIRHTLSFQRLWVSRSIHLLLIRIEGKSDSTFGTQLAKKNLAGCVMGTTFRGNALLLCSM